MDKLQKTLDILKGWHRSGFTPTRDEIKEAMNVLEQGIEEVKIHLTEDFTIIPIPPDAQEPLTAFSVKYKGKTLTGIAECVDMADEDFLAIPHDILKNMKDNNVEFGSTSKEPSPFLRYMRLDENSLEFDKALHDIFIKPQKDILFIGNDSQPTFTMLDIPGYTPIAAHLVIVDDLLYDMEYPEMPSKVVIVSRNIEEKYVTIQVERGIQLEAALLYIPELTTVLVKDNNAKLLEEKQSH